MQKTHSLFLPILLICFCTKSFSQNLQLKIKGCSKYENNIINSLNYTRTHQNYNSIKLEINALEKKLYSEGYIENESGNIKKINDSVFTTQLCLKNKYGSIYINYNKLDVDKSILNSISKDVSDSYFILEFKDIESKLAFINSKITEKGFPFSKLHLADISIKDNGNLKANLIVNTIKSKRLINKTVIKGYEKFPRSYLKHYLKIKPSQIFNLNTIKKKTEQLNYLNFANQAKAPEVLFTNDSTTLYLYLKKIKSNSFNGFLGFNTNETSNKIEFNGYLNLNLINNLNFGESFRLLYKSDENNQNTFTSSLTLPYLFKSPIGVDLELRIFKKDSSFSTINQSAKIHYQINPKHKIYLGLTNLESNNLLNTNIAPNTIDYKTSYKSFGYQYIKPQAYSFLFPINSLFHFETNFGKRNTTGESEKQTQFSIDAYKIFNLNPKNSIYIRSNNAILISNNYLDNELFRFGGINSLRGFDENSILASMFNVLNTEYRFLVSNDIYINSIIDGAYFENKTLNNKQKIFSYGFGFGILTKAGIFKFNYANGKIENQKFKLSNSKIHISLITNF